MSKNKRIDELPLGSPRIGDFMPFRDMTEGITKKVLADQFLTSADDQDFQWVPNANAGVGYADGEFVTYGGKWWESQNDDNLSTPGVDASWSEGSKVYGTLRVWKAGLYTNAEEYVVGYNAQSHLFIWRLATAVARPFNSTNFLNEIAAGQWEPDSKSYIDAISDGFLWKYRADVLADSNVTLSGAQTIDSFAATDGHIALLVNQTDLKENGWWNVKTGPWNRCSFADAGWKIDGAIASIVRGTIHQGRILQQISTGITIGVGDIVFKERTYLKYLRTVDVSGGTPAMNFNIFLHSIFVGSAAIGTAKTWSITNLGIQDHFILRINISAIAIQTFPNTFKSADLSFSSSTFEWTPPSTGYFEIIGDYDGTNWWIKITGPY